MIYCPGMGNAYAPMLLVIVGPPAVGKMTVGQAIAERTGLHLMHNHVSLEVALRYFEFGTAACRRVSDAIRQLVMDEVAASDAPGLVFTFVWAFDEPADHAAVDAYIRPFAERGGRVLFLELEADQQERLRRSAGATRLAEKPSRRDVESARRDLIAFDERYELSSGDRFEGRADYLRIDNTLLTPEEVAECAIAHFGIPRSRPRGLAA
jgi:hypothetical protein